jgi:hypothetical protein
MIELCSNELCFNGVEPGDVLDAVEKACPTSLSNTTDLFMSCLLNVSCGLRASVEQKFQKRYIIIILIISS